jgi:D-glycero-alpha-D-manno-heptose-7-phosphate kinase
LNENFIYFYRNYRKSDTILHEQKQNIANRLPVLRKMKELACHAYKELEAGNIDAMGALLNEGWELKKQMAGGISNGAINEIYQTALKAGADGGKITGAGGGGFLLLYCQHEKQNAVREALKSFQELPFQLEEDSTKVIFNYRR